MRRRRRTLRELLADIRLTPEELQDARAEHCMEALFDAERCECANLGEREEAELEAERRRWAHDQPSNANAAESSTGL
jgi:hypothetical protein